MARRAGSTYAPEFLGGLGLFVFVVVFFLGGEGGMRGCCCVFFGSFI